MRLREAASALVFFGALAGQPDLERAGKDALAELTAKGFTVPTASAPVQVYELPGDSSRPDLVAHAGTWRPGVVRLRRQPQGGHGATTYLRHELMHEASRRTCQGRLPLWAEEAFAVAFSGEAGPAATEAARPEDLPALRDAAAADAPLTAAAARGLRAWVRDHGWPLRPCIVPAAAHAALAPASARALSWRLIHLHSGRVIAAQGDQQQTAPLGSTLKIPYVAALDGPDAAKPELLADLLARSDTAALQGLAGSFAADRYRSFWPPATLPPSLPAGQEPAFAGLLGLRGADGAFFAPTSLAVATSVFRAALLSDWPRFAPLARRQLAGGSTLDRAGPATRATLQALDAVVKTGSVAGANGVPLVGHALVAWPAAAPVYLAVFRLGGGHGFQAVNAAGPVLRRWRESLPVQQASTSVRLLSRLPRAAWSSRPVCGRLPALVPLTPGTPAVRATFDRCGEWELTTQAVKAKAKRRVAGLLVEAPRSGTVLFTDPDTYADGVVAAEADTMAPEAQAALRAVVVWNATAAHRHQGVARLCDTTHCMLYRGQPDGASLETPVAAPTVLGAAWRRLVRLAPRTADPSWLAYEKGGDEPWTRDFAAFSLKAWLRTLAGFGHDSAPQVIDLQRLRLRSGDVSIRIVTDEGETTVTCETFRNALHLLSCPETLTFARERQVWVAKGLGEGHGQGLALITADRLAVAGRSAAGILEDAYQ